MLLKKNASKDMGEMTKSACTLIPIFVEFARSHAPRNIAQAHFVCLRWVEHLQSSFVPSLRDAGLPKLLLLP